MYRYTHGHTQRHTRTRTQARTHAHTGTHRHTHTHAHTHTHTHAHAHAHAHTHTHTHTHTRTQPTSLCPCWHAKSNGVCPDTFSRLQLARLSNSDSTCTCNNNSSEGSFATELKSCLTERTCISHKGDPTSTYCTHTTVTYNVQ